MSRIDHLIQRSIAFALAAMVTLAVLGVIDGLASREFASDALLSQYVTQTHQA